MQAYIQICNSSMGVLSTTLLTILQSFLTYCFESTHYTRTNMPVSRVGQLLGDLWWQRGELLCLPAQEEFLGQGGEHGLQFYQMNVTVKDRPPNTKTDDSSTAASRPKLFELQHYPTEGVMEELAYMLIRPPRFLYNPEMLRPGRKLGGRFTMETFSIPFQLVLYRQEQTRYVVLYLHGNGSSSFEGTLFLPSLPKGVGLACFDFRGCGNREGDFITLGQEESGDVDVAARFLKSRGHRVVGWGRSMGAVSLLLSSECSLIVADSAYSNLAHLCKESSVHFLPKACCCLFHCFFPCVFACIQCKVHKLAGLEIGSMDIAGKLKKEDRDRQICFIHGEQDTLVPQHHVQRLYDSFPGAKMMVVFQGSHNSSRPQEVMAKCFEFIEEGLKERRPQVRVNTKILEMGELQRIPQLSNISRIAASKPVGSITPTLESSDQQPMRRDMSNCSALHRRPLQEEYCQIDMKKGVPANFKDAMQGEELQRAPEGSETTSDAGRRGRMTQLIFSKRKS